VHLLLESGQIFVQIPSQFCSPYRAPGLSHKELAMLSELGLNAPSSTMFDVKSTPNHLGMTSQTDPDTSSFMDYDLNKTVEENEAILSKKKKMKFT